MTLALGLARLGSALHRSPEHLVLRQSSAAAEFLHNQSPQPSQERPLPHPTGPPPKQGVSLTTTPALQGTGPFQPPGTNIECRSLMRLLEDLPLLLAGWNPTMSPTMIRPATREMKVCTAEWREVGGFVYSWKRVWSRLVYVVVEDEEHRWTSRFWRT